MILMPINPDDVCTELEDGTTVPVRIVGDRYIVAHDCLDAAEFIRLVGKVVDEDEVVGYWEEDVHWALASDIDFDVNPAIVFASPDSFNATPITVLQRW